MRRSLSPWALLLSFCFLESLHAATQVEGVATYELFRNGGEKPLLRVEEKFSAIFQGDKWLVDIKLVSIQPPAPPQLFCPPTQKAGSDGGDTYFLKFMPKPNETNQDLVGWVEPGSIPNMSQSPTASLIWLAFCSGDYLKNTGQQELNPVWTPSSNENLNRQDKCSMSVNFQLDPDNLEFLDQLNYLNDGRLDPCNLSRSYTNLYAPPWNAGYTQAVFEVEKTIAIPDRQKIPGAFTFQIFAPTFRSSPPRLGVVARIHGVVTNITTDVQLASWLPQVPDNQRVEVRDYRFTDVVTNWQAVRYAATGQFYTRTSSSVSTAVRIHEETKPVPPEAVQMRKVSKPPINHNRAILIAAMALLLIVTSVWCFVKKMNR
jgi:hypothetical protein